MLQQWASQPPLLVAHSFTSARGKSGERHGGTCQPQTPRHTQTLSGRDPQASPLQTGPTRGDRCVSPGPVAGTQSQEHQWACASRLLGWLCSPGPPGLLVLGPGGGHALPRSGPAPGPRGEDGAGRGSPDPPAPGFRPALVCPCWNVGASPWGWGITTLPHPTPDPGPVGLRLLAGRDRALPRLLGGLEHVWGDGATRHSAFPQPWPSRPHQVRGGSASRLPRPRRPEAGHPGIVGKGTWKQLQSTQDPKTQQAGDSQVLAQPTGGRRKSEGPPHTEQPLRADGLSRRAQTRERCRCSPPSFFGRVPRRP